MLIALLPLLAVLQRPDSTPATQQTPSAIATARAVPAAKAPVIDGRDEDAVWRTAPVTSDFRQFSPTVGGSAAFRTAFRVAYDARNLYVFVRMYDPHPDSIMHALSRRDVRGPSDQVKLLIDSYHDRRSGFQMAVNPDGVKRDFSISNDNQEDDTWNGIWDVATKVDAEGWTAEFRIPMSQLRYSGHGVHTFGFGIWRDIERLNERDSWPEFLPTKNGLASQLGSLEGLDGISSARNIEVTPYAVTRNQQAPGSGAPYTRQQKLTLGGDVKIGLTPNITLAASVNPDFGQVEADPGVLNLTAFENFFAERRPFFVEGTGLYQFQLNCFAVVDCGTNEGLFYSRRIGRSPSLRGEYGDAATPNSTPIAAATKLTGRTRSGLSFGLLDAYAQRVTGPADRTVEPGTNYTVLRAQQDLRGGETGISVIATAVNRSLDSLTTPFLSRSAYVGGATFRNRFHEKQYELAAQFTASRVSGADDAIARVQRSAVHYFQQPGGKRSLDTTVTSLSGYAGQIKFGKYGGGITRFETSLVHQTAGYDVNDLGFLRRADVTDWSTWGALAFQTATKYFRWAQLNGNHWEKWNTAGTRLDNAVNFNGHMGLLNNWDVHLGGTFNGITPISCDRCTRGGPVLRVSRGFYPWGGFNTDSRKTVAGGVFVNMSRRDEGHSRGVNASPYVALRVSTRLAMNVGVDYGRDDDAAQWFGNFTDSIGTTHYAFARLNQRTISTSVRINYTFTPSLTFEFYGQPFVATGTYSDLRELSATPDAAAFTDRYRLYTPPAGSETAFRYVQLRTNAVARWEYRPGSTFFLVWAHGREASSGDNPNQPWTREYRDLFRLHPDNAFLIKMAYWLNR
jgi:Domain of unknown function (DUF5916)/Carbohydrate family 9 binding domain-like